MDRLYRLLHQNNDQETRDDQSSPNKKYILAIKRTVPLI